MIAERIHPLGAINGLAKQAFGETPGITLSIHDRLTTAIVFAKAGKIEPVERALGISSLSGLATHGDGFTAFPMALGQWLLVSKVFDGDFAETLATNMNGVGYVSDQSDARVGFRISGPQTQELMLRGCRLDLHASVAPQDFCAQTIVAQTGVTIHKVSDEPAYDLYVFAGFARSFWHWLKTTAKQFGYRIEVI